jgi:antitoxin component of MazEF toxin-antitoxin module
MTRTIVNTGSSLAVTLPKEVVEQFKLKKGDSTSCSFAWSHLTWAGRWLGVS